MLYQLKKYAVLPLSLLLLVYLFSLHKLNASAPAISRPGWNELTYAITMLCGIGMSVYICLFVLNNDFWKIRQGVNLLKIILFAELALLGYVYVEIDSLVFYYIEICSRNLTLLWRGQLYSARFTYGLLQFGCMFWLLIPRKIGYVLSMQMVFYPVDLFVRRIGWEDQFLWFSRLWWLFLIFVLIFSILFHSKTMLRYWKIETRSQWYVCLGIALAIALGIHFLEWWTSEL